jgi:hypothetical protein
MDFDVSRLSERPFIKAGRILKGGANMPGSPVFYLPDSLPPCIAAAAARI